jgi:hypothetical protein
MRKGQMRNGKTLIREAAEQRPHLKFDQSDDRIKKSCGRNR